MAFLIASRPSHATAMEPEDILLKAQILGPGVIAVLMLQYMLHHHPYSPWMSSMQLLVGLNA
eukprot:2845305-Ditylum_brightwellii.AAC.2